MYTHFYGFSEEPFRDVPDPRFLFSVPGRQSALNRLKQGIEERNGWILLWGEPGSGKTVLIRHLLQNLQEKAGFRAVHIFQTRISFEDLLKGILSGLKLPAVPETGASVSNHFVAALGAFLSPQEVLVLFLDEAQNFDPEALEKISLFFAREYPRPAQVQIVFSGQPPLEEIIQSQGLSFLQRQIKVRCPVPPLTPQESRRYIDHRLHLAGGSADLFTPESLKLVIRRGEGLPRTLNILCDNALRIGHQLSEPKITPAIVRKALREMYVPNAFRRAQRKPAGKRSWLRKTPFFLAAAVVLAAVFYYANREPLGKKEGGGNIKAEPSASPDPQASPSPPAPPEKPIEQMEAKPPSPAKAPPPEFSHMQSSPAAASGKADWPAPKVMKTVPVKEGNTLSSICFEHYGYANLTLLDYILILNPDLADPNFVQIGQRILLPEIHEDLLLRENPGGRFEVFLGTFANPDPARIFRSMPILKENQVRIDPRKTGAEETWHRVSAAEFLSGEEARKTLRVLRDRRLLPAFGGFPDKR